MKKKIFLAIILIILFSTNCSIMESDKNKPLDKPDDDQYVLRFADIWGDNHPTVIGDKEFARLVKKRSNGKVKIIVYTNAQLGDEQSVLDQVRLGGIDFARVNTSIVGKINFKMSILTLPYLFRDSEHLWDVLNGSVGEELLDSINDVGLKGLAFYDSGSRSFYSKKSISSIEDLSKLKIRVTESDTSEEFIRLIGASPVQMPFGEVYDALQQDFIDAAENNWTSFLYSNHYLIAKYYILDCHTVTPEIIIVNNKTFNNLPKKYQEIIISSAKDSIKVQRESWERTEKETEKIIRNLNIEIINVSDEEKNKLKLKIMPLYEDYTKKYKNLIDQIENTKK
ncbi:MAG: TRAP transporter substrate-binding protein [Clostridiales bacterium]